MKSHSMTDQTRTRRAVVGSITGVVTALAGCGSSDDVRSPYDPVVECEGDCRDVVDMNVDHTTGVGTNNATIVALEFERPRERSLECVFYLDSEIVDARDGTMDGVAWSREYTDPAPQFDTVVVHVTSAS